MEDDHDTSQMIMNTSQMVINTNSPMTMGTNFWKITNLENHDQQLQADHEQ